MKIGILALQGDVPEHAAAIARSGAEPHLIRQRGDLGQFDGLVLPGGESTTISLLLDRTGLRSALAEWTSEGRPTLGTCAGLVLLASTVVDGRPEQRGLGGLDVVVRRNGHGRQRSSFEASVPCTSLGGSFEAVFIRAPRILETGPAVEVLAAIGTGDDAEAVIVRQGSVIGCAFHPELAGDDRLHQELIEQVRSTTG